MEDEDGVVLANRVIETLFPNFVLHNENTSKNYSKLFATFKLHLAAVLLKDVKFDEKVFLESIKDPEKLLGVFILKEK